MILIFKEDRDKEFFNLCMKIKQGTNLSVDEVVQKAIDSPATSFFLTYDGFRRIVYHKGDVSDSKKELYKTIKRLYEKHKCENMKETFKRIDELPAPRFYMSKARAISLYYELIKKYNDEIRCRINFYNRVFGI